MLSCVQKANAFAVTLVGLHAVADVYSSTAAHGWKGGMSTIGGKQWCSWRVN